MAKYDAQLVIRITKETRRKLAQRAERENRKETALARIMIEKSLLREK